MLARVFSCSHCELNSSASFTPCRAAMSPTSRTLVAASPRSPRPRSTGLITVVAPTARARAHCSSNTRCTRARSSPCAHSQPSSTPTHATGKPLPFTRSITCSAVSPRSTARVKSRRRSSTAPQPAFFTIGSNSASGVVSSVQVCSASFAVPVMPVHLLVDALALADPFAVAQREFLDLARRGLGKLAELNRRRALEAGDVLPAELDDVLLAGLRALLERDECLGTLPPLLIRNRHHRAFEDGRVLGDGLLDLDGRDVLSAGDDDVLLAIATLDVAVGMPDADVPRVEPAAPEGLRSGIGLLEVTLHDVVAAHDDLAQGLAVLTHICHVVVHDPDEVGDHVGLSLAGGSLRPLLVGERVPLRPPLAHGM